MLALCVALSLLALLCAPTIAEDTVYVYLSAGATSAVRFTGDIQEYTGKELTIRTSSDLRTFDSKNVTRVETPRSDRHEQAEKQFAAGKLKVALPLYSQALEGQTEPRRWVRREILSRIALCQQGMGNHEMAADYFLTLLADDPHALHLDCIPLAWWPEQPTAAFERKAKQWLESNHSAEALLGASYLLTTSQRTAAVEKLSALKQDKDARIAALARTQSWRTVPNMTDRTFTDWKEDLERMPQPFRYGAYFLLGAAYARQAQGDQAALYSLRVPILYPRQQALAARALLEAGRTLEKAGQPREAEGLFREVKQRFGETRAAADLAGPGFNLQ